MISLFLFFRIQSICARTRPYFFRWCLFWTHRTYLWSRRMYKRYRWAGVYVFSFWVLCWTVFLDWFQCLKYQVDYAWFVLVHLEYCFFLFEFRGIWHWIKVLTKHTWYTNGIYSRAGRLKKIVSVWVGLDAFFRADSEYHI